MTTPFKSSFLDALRAMPAKMKSLFVQYGTDRLTIGSKPRLSQHANNDEIQQAQNAIRSELASLKKKALADVEDLRALVAKEADGVRGVIAVALQRAEPKDTQEALLRELREQRAWARNKSLLDQASVAETTARVSEMVETALLANDDDTLSALRAELPSYLTARQGAELVPGIDDMMTQKLAQHRPHLKPALEARKEVEQGIYNLTLNLNYLTHNIEKDEPYVIFSGWEKNTAETIECAPNC